MIHGQIIYLVAVLSVFEIRSTVIVYLLAISYPARLAALERPGSLVQEHMWVSARPLGH